MVAFHTPTYSQNKADWLNEKGQTFLKKYQGPWTAKEFLEVISEWNITPRQHYQKFGMKENVSPYQDWDEYIYLTNKKNQLNSIGETHSGVPAYCWHEGNLRSVLARYGMTPLIHYERYGRAEGISFLPKDIWVPSILDAHFYEYAGNGDCPFLLNFLIGPFENVIKSLMKDNPLMKPLILGDACPKYGECPGHPTHNKLTEVDIDYPLYSGGATQYGSPVEQMWLSTDPANMILDEDKVNWWVIWQLLTRLKVAFHSHQTQFIVHEKVFDFIGKHITQTQLNELRVISTFDEGVHWNHHTHMHINLLQR